MLTEKNLQTAMDEARRFLERAEVVMKAKPADHRKDWSLNLGKDSSAVKRSSLDLTRALAELRSRY